MSRSAIIIDESGRPLGDAWVEATGLPDNPRMRDGLEGALEAEIGRVLARAKRAELADDDALDELIQRAVRADLQRRGRQEAGVHGDDQPAGGVSGDRGQSPRRPEGYARGRARRARGSATKSGSRSVLPPARCCVNP